LAAAASLLGGKASLAAQEFEGILGTFKKYPGFDDFMEMGSKVAVFEKHFPRAARVAGKVLEDENISKLADFAFKHGAAASKTFSSVAGSAASLAGLLTAGGVVGAGIAGVAGYELGSAIMYPSTKGVENRLEANRILSSNQSVLTDFVNVNRYNTRISSDLMSNLVRSSNETYAKYSSSNTYGLFGSQYVFAAQMQTADNQLAMFSLKHGNSVDATRYSAEALARNSRTIQLQLDRDRGRDVGVLSSLLGMTLGILPGTNVYQASYGRDNFDRAKQALGGQLLAAY
jgi:hypothetical protein